ncbi:MAG: AI-2E family transporter [Firmicutes bacterium]|uniref:Predicted PurR-regulated permease PerM n=1 Tax=Melghirimyces thermohalophilus TaxID=1236220 RepID=A0A1G6KL08_9BACL|nr:AI-2E family transporter [Melghirimyces thermohalophilus]MDA8354344.1 AI-2E family transporter [Bacillota bacterium]SDC31617.1 Predicted PurR-regulated permease PerM [Melghirimyces thermohalophilus]
MPQSKPFRIGYGILLAFLIILVGTKIDFIFKPLVVLVQTLFFPFLVAGVLYYLFRPVVRFLEKKGVPRVISILLIYLLFIGLAVLIVFLAGPPLQKQVTRLVENFDDLIASLQTKLVQLQHNPWVGQYFEQQNLEKITRDFTDYLSSSIMTIVTNIANFFSILTSIIVVFVTVPFILFYMLKEGEAAPKQVLRLLPAAQRSEGRRILSDMDRAISSYIQGQVLVSICVGVLVYIGYLIIGLDYSLLLALVTMFTNLIPFVGPLIGTIPAVIVAFIDTPFMVVKVLLVTVFAQQLEGNVISPQVMGRTLNIHPLTIILLLLVAGSLGGFLGLLLAVPTYAVLKVVVSHTYRLFLLRNRKSHQPDTE